MGSGEKGHLVRDLGNKHFSSWGGGGGGGGGGLLERKKKKKKKHYKELSESCHLDSRKRWHGHFIALYENHVLDVCKF